MYQSLTTIMDVYHHMENIEGVQCIAWDERTHDPITNKSIPGITKIKNRVGASNLDIPILDSKKTEKGRQICNIIIHTESLARWVNSLKEFYSSYDQSTRNIKEGTKQLILRKEGKSKEGFLTILLYSKSSKLMIQPGEKDVNNLFAFLRDYRSILSLLLKFKKNNSSMDEVETDSESEQEEQQDEQLQENSSQNPPTQKEIEDEADTSKGSDNRDEVIASKELDPQSHTDNQYDGDEESEGEKDEDKRTPKSDATKVSEPQQHPLVTSFSQTSAVPLSKGTQTGAQPVINELLCFVQNRMERIPVNMITRLCADFYSNDEIFASKKLLFHMTEDKQDFRLIKHLGVNKKTENMKDIIRCLVCVDDSDKPLFVARDLSKLPPITALDNDVMSLHREMQQLKADMKIVKECQSDIAKLSKEVKSVKAETAGAPINGSPIRQTKKEKIQQKRSPRPETYSPKPSTSGTSRPARPSPENRIVSDSDETDKSSSNLSGRDDSPTWAMVLARNKSKKSPMGSDIRRGKPEKGRQSNIEVVIGRGHSRVIRAARPPPKSPTSKKQESGRHVTGIFVTKLERNTSSAQLATQIYQECGLSVRPEKLPVLNHYSSFFIRCGKQQRGILLDRDLWPRGAAVRPYYE